jgi:hypothetical protein
MTAPSPRFAALRLRYAQALPEKRVDFERAWCAWHATPDEPGAAMLQALAHRLAGSAPPYGYDALGVAARALDAMLDDWLKRAPHERERADVLAELVAPHARAVLEGFTAAIGATSDPR